MTSVDGIGKHGDFERDRERDLDIEGVRFGVGDEAIQVKHRNITSKSCDLFFAFLFNLCFVHSF